MNTRIKICGITRPADAQNAAACGVDAIGLVFYPPSKRSVEIAQAAEIVAALPPLVTVVALFVDAQATEIDQVLHRVPVDVLQFHGDEPASFCAAFQRPWLKALRMAPDLDLAAAAAAYSGARAVLLDSWKEGVPGGTGETFDWQRVQDGLDSSLVLAGGLNPANVKQGIRTVRPAAVDVSGGVESAPGVKSVALMEKFVTAVRAVDEELETP